MSQQLKLDSILLLISYLVEQCENLSFKDQNTSFIFSNFLNFLYFLLIHLLISFFIINFLHKEYMTTWSELN